MLSQNTKGYASRARYICEQIAAGGSLETVCAEEGLPQIRTVRRWLMDSRDFRRRYAQARRMRAHRLVEQVVEIADSLPATPSEAETRRQRLRIEARKWAVAQVANPALEDEADTAPPAPLTYTLD